MEDKQIDELEKTLSTKEGEEEIARRLHARVTLPTPEKNFPSAWNPPRPPPADDSYSRMARYQRRIMPVLVFGTFALLLAGAAIFVFFYLGIRGREADVMLGEIRGAEAGELLTIPVTVRNVSRTRLTHAELTLVLPPGSLVVEEGKEKQAPPRLVTRLDDFSPGEARSVEIPVRLFGSEGDALEVQAVFLYRPENFKALFSVKAIEKVVLERVPLALSIDIPETLSNGQEVLMTFRYRSETSSLFPDFALRAVYPPGFTFVSANPPPSADDNLWRLSDVPEGEERTVTVRGTIHGNEGEIQAVQAALGASSPLTKEWRSYRDVTREFKIAASPLSLEARVNEGRDGAVTPGERIHVSLAYKNNTASSLRNVTVRAALEDSGGDILLPESIAPTGGGVYDEARREVVWGPANVAAFRELAPGESGEFGFTIRTRETPLVKTDRDTNLTVRLRAKVSAANIPEEFAGRAVGSEDTITMKVRSVVRFHASTLYRSDILLNKGPLPPKVGAKTTYALVWELRTFTNDIKDVMITGFLPENVTWQNVIVPSGAGIQYDEASRKVSWVVSEMKAGTGVRLPAAVAAFQVAITPASADISRPIELLRDIAFTATDVFTGERVDLKVLSLTTELRDDALSVSKEWSVVK